ncbi:MAG: hypothetical protein CMM26_11745 [Rhodospirillaceae bacterium]|nr:hypothetical protein [Rhodospirillaceae bacterium]
MLFGLFLLAACAGGPPDNPIIGDWHLATPSGLQWHGNIIGFRDDCLIVRGDLVSAWVARPVIFEEGIDGTFVWYGPPAAADLRSNHAAARVIFISPDRIQVFWPHGDEANYLRALGPARTDNRDCRTP